jgi:signal transduction histidine kinase
MTVGAYRIVQEALANSARHSGAPVAHVSIGLRDRHLLLLVSDEGRGFDPGATVDLGIGLAGMYERAELLGGNLSVQSAVGHGTRVTLTLPLGDAAR